ncbi:STAS domain-containing protein [Streptomyces sp. NPDC058305]|uniref:STAS domain-containing protein n=1 Tax=Streptomyces sp. NPDC058305 TaxID=3346438 RepID=UPI0036E0986E
MNDDIKQHALLSISRTVHPAGVQVTACGEIDGDTAGLLGDALRVDTAGSRLVLDLGAVTFLDSSSIKVLFAAGQDAVSAGGWLRLAAMTPSVEEVKIVDLDLPRVIACYPAVSQAHAA